MNTKFKLNKTGKTLWESWRNQSIALIVDNTNKSQMERETAEALGEDYKDDTLVFDANNKLDKTASEIKADVLQHLREQQLKREMDKQAKELKRETDKQAKMLKREMDEQAKQAAPKRKRTASPSTTAKRTKQAEDMHPK